MPEAHTSFKGKLLQVSDEAVQDYVAEVGMLRTLYEEAGSTEVVLAEHIRDLKQLDEELVGHFDDSDNKDHSVDFWFTIVSLATRSGEGGHAFLQAHGYNRVSRFLAVEFGGRETATTLVLRSIANEVLKTRLDHGSRSQVLNFFDYELPSSIIDTIYPTPHCENAHPMLKDFIERAEQIEGLCSDPAFARVVSTLMSRSSGLVERIPVEIRKGALIHNKAIFSDRGMTTKAIKPIIVNWESKEEDEAKTGAKNDTNSEDETPDTDNELVEFIAAKLDFDVRKARCRIPKVPGLNTEEHELMMKDMLDTMFPSRGDDTGIGKEICSQCPVREECLAYALENGIQYGIWGGESERSRREMRKLINVVVKGRTAS